MDGSVPPPHDGFPIGPPNISHSTDGSYNENASNKNTAFFGSGIAFQNVNPIPGLNQSAYLRLARVSSILNTRRLVISVLGGPQPPMHGHRPSISPTIYSPGERIPCAPILYARR